MPEDISTYFSIAKVDILPPERLFHPVLPVKIAKKCRFTLCAACTGEQLQRPWHQRTNMCSHNTQERTLQGTWYTEDLQKAVEKGYQIRKNPRGTALA